MDSKDYLPHSYFGACISKLKIFSSSDFSFFIGCSSVMEKFYARKRKFLNFVDMHFSSKIFGVTFLAFTFLAIFRNEITTILTPSTSEGGEWRRRGWLRFSFLRPLITNPQCLYTYIFICIRSYNTGRSFEPIFMKFTRFVRVLSWMTPIIFGNNRPNRTTDMGENVPPKPIFWVWVSRYGDFWEKNYKTVIGTPFPEKMLFLLFDAPFPQKWSSYPLKKY